MEKWERKKLEEIMGLGYIGGAGADNTGNCGGRC